MPLDWQGAGILLVINVLMIFYITSRKKTIVPSQSLDSVQQQHACKDVYNFFILPKNRYIDHKIITIIHKNQIIRNKIIKFITTILQLCVELSTTPLPSHQEPHHPNNSAKPNPLPFFKKNTKDSTNSAKSIIFVGDKSQYIQHHIL